MLREEKLGVLIGDQGTLRC